MNTEDTKEKRKKKKYSPNILFFSGVGSEYCHNWLNNSEYQYKYTSDWMSASFL